MFWGLILKSNKKYTQTLEKSFHLSMASLDHGSSDNDPVQVMYSQDENSYLLCTLQKGKQLQCQLDLNFAEGDKLCFSTKGSGIVHLTGFLVPEEDFDEDAFGDMDMDESDDEAEIEDLRQKLEAGKKKQKPEKAEAAAAKKKQQAQQEESDEEEADSDEEADDSDDVELDETAAAVDSDDDDEGDESDDEEESDEEEVAAPPPKQAKLDKQAQQNGKKQKQNGLENGEKKQQQKKEKGGEGKIQKLQGGLLVQDLKVGTGAEAKPGKKIQVYYEGRLKANNKIFDATKNGPGFKMTVGRGEVIKAWDIGLVGMKVGGKRRLVCPPQLAYGAKGNPPVIPQNSTLVFDVELKNVL